MKEVEYISRRFSITATQVQSIIVTPQGSYLIGVQLSFSLSATASDGIVLVTQSSDTTAAVLTSDDVPRLATMQLRADTGVQDSGSIFVPTHFRLGNQIYAAVYCSAGATLAGYITLHVARTPFR